MVNYATGLPFTSFLTIVPVPGVHAEDGSSTAPNNVHCTGGGFSIQTIETCSTKTFSHCASLCNAWSVT